MSIPPKELAGPSVSAKAGELAVRARGLGKWFNDRPVLHDLTFEIPSGRIVALMGANGAGKSTLLRILATLIPASRGELHLFGHRVTPTAANVRARIGMVAHQPMLYGDLSPRENLTFFGRLYGLARPADRVAELLEVVGLSARGDDPVKTLSRGMVQRVAIARALTHNPDLLLADEPFDGLDAPSAKSLEGLLRRLRDEGKTLVLSSHDVAACLALSDWALVLRKGRAAIDRPSAGLGAAEVLGEIGQA